MVALEAIQLADYRQQVFKIYARVREPTLTPVTRWERFRSDRDLLFKTHPQTPLAPENVAAFSSLDYFPYDPTCRFLLPIEFLKASEVITRNLQDDGWTIFKPFAKISFVLAGQPLYLTLYWIVGYGGGIFLPFKDTTSAGDTYSGGRYLLDTIKGASLGHKGDHLVIDFNFAYNPSCAYSPRWHCPLPPVENHLSVPIRAGEKRFE